LYAQLSYAPQEVPSGLPISEAAKNYEEVYAQSIHAQESGEFWSEQANRHISWFSPFKSVVEGDFLSGDVNWFGEGILNACYNCVDRHIPTKAQQTALIWEGDEPGTQRLVSYEELRREVSKIANIMKMQGVKKGDVVTIYMPMIPELAMVMLACARIGAVHTVVFAGFSAESLSSRIEDGNSQFIFVANEGLRGGKAIKLKDTVDKVT
jgi:acetyl-CoA synthetase